MNQEKVDILDPSSLLPAGITKPVEDALRAGEWIGSFNLWIVRRCPVPAILYQLRAVDADWAPGLLDVAAGGRYWAGETLQDGLREVREELGKDYAFSNLIYLGKKLYMKDESGGLKLRCIVDVCMHEDNADISSFVLQREELAGLFICPVDQLLSLHSGELRSFRAEGVCFKNDALDRATIEVRKESFPFNWDRYHYKMAVLISRYFRGENHLLY
jgi:hypothetical protein